jgi:hypothetical protein
MLYLRRFTLLILFYNSMSAQGYRRFLNNTSWFEEIGNFGGPTNFWYYQDHDSTVNMKIYTMIRASNNNNYAFLFREDTIQKKVYALQSGTSTELLIYDFDGQIGSNFTFYNPANGNNKTFQLDSIDSVQTSMGSLKRLNYSCTQPNMEHFSIIEGVGSLEDPIEVKQFIADPVYYLVCNFQNGQHVYSNPIFPANHCPSVQYTNINEDFTQVDSFRISVYPNPANEEVIISSKETSEDYFMIFCDLTGRTIYSLKNISGEKSIINTSDFENGIYFLSVETANGKIISQKKIVVQH